MRLVKQVKRVLGLSSVCCVILGACGSLTPSPETESSAPLFCSEAAPILFSRLHDTPETIAQVKAHNAVGVRLCHWAVAP